MVGITHKEAIYKLYFPCGPSKSKILELKLELLELKLMLSVSKKWRLIYTEAIWKY